MKKLVLLLILALSAGFVHVPGGSAQESDPLIEDSLEALDSLVAPENCTQKDAVDGEVEDDVERPFVLCDDGVPPEGGGSDGIPVPVAYHKRKSGADFHGLPRPASAEEAAAADAKHDLRPEEDGRRITLDVNVTLPPDSKRPPAGRPVIVLMHGCCGGNKTSWQAETVDAAGEKWHHSNAWWASRGYVVVTYTARGFRDGSNRGSTGTTQLDSRRYEINDYQYLVGLLADHDARTRSEGNDTVFDINPQKVAAVGGSYGGGFSWLALTDPRWRSPLAGTPIRLAAAVPKYGWTDLVEALVPSGHYLDRHPKTKKTFIAPSAVDKALSTSPIGVEKESIVTGLYATGNLVSGNHTTFPAYMHSTYARLQLGEPYDGDATIDQIADSFLRDRSAYFQKRFWERVRNGVKVPMFVPATWTDPLFPAMESVRFYNKLRKLKPKYPVSMYLGDYQHFAANKAKEWNDLCGADHHVCTVDDFRRKDGRIDFRRSKTRVRKGISTRINRFLDHYLKGKKRTPPLRVASTTTICAANATEKLPVDEPGVEFRAPTWRKLAPRLKTYTFVKEKTTSSPGNDNHAAESDPVYRDRQSDKCYTTTSKSPGSGVAQYTSKKIKKRFTMAGVPTMRLEYETTATDYWISARLFDERPDGSLTMVTRGVCRVNKAAHPKVDCKNFDLFGNSWIFKPGHRVVLELSQAYSPFLRIDNFPSTITYKRTAIEIPITKLKRRSDFRF